MKFPSVSPLIALALAACVALAACGDDAADPRDGTSTADATVTPDTAEPGDTRVADTDVGPDAVDPCDPNPCTEGAPVGCSADGLSRVTYEAEGTCSDDGGVAACDYPIATTTSCEEGACEEGACVSTVAACGYEAQGDVTYITRLRLGNIEGDGSDACCFDYDADGEDDNKIGDLVRLVMGLPQVTADVNDVIAENIESGQFTMLIELSGAALPSAADVDLALFYGTDTDDDHANNVAGEGTFTADLISFEPGTADPVTTFEGALITNGNLFAGPSVFRLSIPLESGLVIEGDLRRARLEGMVVDEGEGLVIDDDGLGVKLGGVFHQDQLFGALNNFVASTCGCLDPGTRDGSPRTVVEKVGEHDWACNGDVDTSACDDSEGSDDAPCLTLVDVCDAAMLLVQPDIDAEGDDGVEESLSVGLWFEGTRGEIVGVAPDVCE